MSKLALAASLLIAHGGAPSGLGASEILARMARAYAECETYRDSGAVTTVFHKARGDVEYERTVCKPFTTAFVRPDRFRFEFLARRGEEEQDRYLVWREGSLVRTWWDVRPGVAEPRSLRDALAGPTGVSGGSANRIPTLLMPGEVGWNSLDSLAKPERIDDALLGARMCHRVVGRQNRDDVTLWIDAQTFLLLRIEEQTRFDDFRTAQTTDYAPELGVPIPPSELVFDPPEPRSSPEPSPADAAPTSESPAPEEILEQMEQVYAECGTYRDTGVVTTVMHQLRGDVAYERTERMPFTTAFVRPDRVRHEVLSRRGETEFDRHLAWCNGTDVRKWWDVTPGVETPASLTLALSGSSIGFGGTNPVLALLLPEVRGFHPRRMSGLTRLEDAAIGTIPCHRIVGDDGLGSVTLWIDRESSLLRRVERSRSGAARMESTLDFEPEIDVAIDESELVFDPPERR